jgi:hypothetical protein
VDNLVSAAVLGLKNMHGLELEGYKRFLIYLFKKKKKKKKIIVVIFSSEMYFFLLKVILLFTTYACFFLTKL